MPLLKGKSKKAFEHNIETEMHAGKPQKQSLAIAYAMKRKAQHKAEGGKLTAEAREHIAAKNFAGPDRSYPIEDRAHARNALARVAQHGSAELQAKVRSKVHSKYPDIGEEHKYMGGYAEGGEAKPSQPRPHLPGSPEDRKKIQDSFNGALGLAEGGMLTHSGYQDYCTEDCETPCTVHQQAEPMEHELPPDPPHSEGMHMDLNQRGNQSEGAGDMDRIHPLIKKIMMGRAKGYSEGGKVANEDHGPMDSRLAGFDQNEFDDLALRDDLSQSYTGKNSGDELGNSQEDKDRRDIVSRIMKSRSKKDRMPNPA